MRGAMTVAAVAIAVMVLGMAAPAAVLAGTILAALVLADPAGVGRRIRDYAAWWGIPGLRRASGRAVTFAALVLAYTVPGPIAAAGVIHAAAALTAAGPQMATVVVAPDVTAVSTAGDATAPAVAPAPRPVAPIATAAAAPPVAVTSGARCGAPANPWGFTFCRGAHVSSWPLGFCSYFQCASNFGTSAGYVVECADGTYSVAGGLRSGCVYHGGAVRPLLR